MLYDIYEYISLRKRNKIGSAEFKNVKQACKSIENNAEYNKYSWLIIESANDKNDRMEIIRFI